MSARPIERWRTLALAILVLGTAGTAIELYLLEHMEETAQWVPVIALVAGLLASLWALITHARAAIVTLRAVMALYVPVALVGIWLHFKSNMEFELELRPSMAGSELLFESLKGAMPALAPGAMLQLGLLGLLVCWNHPSLSGRIDTTSGEAS